MSAQSCTPRGSFTHARVPSNACTSCRRRSIRGRDPGIDIVRRLALSDLAFGVAWSLRLLRDDRLRPRSFSRPPFAAITLSSSATAFGASSGRASCDGRLAAAPADRRGQPARSGRSAADRPIRLPALPPPLPPRLRRRALEVAAVRSRSPISTVSKEPNPTPRSCGERRGVADQHDRQPIGLQIAPRHALDVVDA